MVIVLVLEKSDKADEREDTQQYGQVAMNFKKYIRSCNGDTWDVGNHDSKHSKNPHFKYSVVWLVVSLL